MAFDLKSYGQSTLSDLGVDIQFGDQGFSIAAPDAWNSLPLEIKTAPSLCVFTGKLIVDLIFDR